MNAASLHAALDVVVVGHLDGHGRTVLWRTPGARDVAAAVRQAAVVPGRFDTEPGWILRRLPDGRLLFMVGGTRHPGLADAFGRAGILHGVGIIGTPGHIAVALCASDPVATCLQSARASMRGFGTVPALEQACQAAARDGPLQEGGEGDVPATDWPSAQAGLRATGMHPFAGPIGGRLVAGQELLPAGPLEALRLDVGEAAAKKVIAAWS